MKFAKLTKSQKQMLRWETVGAVLVDIPKESYNCITFAKYIKSDFGVLQMGYEVGKKGSVKSSHSYGFRSNLNDWM
jgi:hypothetical protein